MARMTLDDLVMQLRAAFGGELRAVVLYGSAASGEHVPKKSDYNVLVLVDSLAADRLAGASAAAHAWADAGNSPPLTLTMEEWRGSADIFPMEYADVLEWHKVLYGELPTDVRVDPAHLRLELEHEAMGTLLQLRRGALAAGNEGREQLELLEASASTILVVFRAFLRFRGEAPPTDRGALVERVAVAAGLDAEPFLAMVRHKRGAPKLKAAGAGGVLAGTLDGVQRLVKHLDRSARG
ncbi:MAG TPA: hypothetical protein VMN03_00010 [Burkholderiales bacterium]|nr:hypothetical protein [Burkholderiales bacterium]